MLCNCFGPFTNENLGYLTLLRCLFLFLIDVFLLLNISSTSLNSINLVELITLIASSMGILTVYLLISKYSDVFYTKY